MMFYQTSSLTKDNHIALSFILSFFRLTTMWQAVLPAIVCGPILLANESILNSRIASPSPKDPTPVFRTTPLLIVLEAMIENIYVDQEMLVQRVLENDQLALSREEAAAAVASAKQIVVRPVAHPEWFHRTLASFEGDIDPNCAKFQGHFWSHVPANDVQEFLNSNVFTSLVTAWFKLCIQPLRQGVISCYPIERTRTDGVTEKHWILTDAAFVRYMGNLRWLLRLQAFS